VDSNKPLDLPGHPFTKPFRVDTSSKTREVQSFSKDSTETQVAKFLVCKPRFLKNVDFEMCSNPKGRHLSPENLKRSFPRRFGTLLDPFTFQKKQGGK